MIPAEDFITGLLELGYTFYSGVPCSYLEPLINYAINSDKLAYIASSNEGQAVALCSGAVLSGRKAVVMMQNSGLGNAVNPLSSLNFVFRIPLLLIITLRGEPGKSDEPQHELMGRITSKMLEAMDIPWAYFPAHKSGIRQALKKADDYMKESQRPYAFIMRKGAVSERSTFPETRIRVKQHSRAKIINKLNPGEKLLSRSSLLNSLIRKTPRSEAIVIATTGFTGRELYAIKDRVNHLYMVGSMGCALPLGLGMALNLPQKRIIVLDGDGALLMHMGAMPLIGTYGIGNLRHILLDNGAYLSTGGQSTVSEYVDFCAIARACGYQRIICGQSAQTLEEFLNHKAAGDGFLHLKVNSLVPENLPRPSIKPYEAKSRLTGFLRTDKGLYR